MADTSRPSLRHSDRQKGPTADELLLESAVLPERPDALRKTDPWRVLRIMAEFVEGFEKLGDIQDAVAIFGSARVQPDDPYYQVAVTTARLLSERTLAGDPELALPAHKELRALVVSGEELETELGRNQ